MSEIGLIEIEVACAWPAKQIIRSLQVPSGTTARQALRQSGLADEFTNLDCDSVTLGVFGHVVPDSYVLCAGERVEVYRSLRRDPREARRARAAL
jgi:putative ubiquitin-RnfH superfamily antitoxin RatB of RatAB toxin-antitoxin module